MVEMIVTIAIAAILMGAAVSLIGHIHYANAMKAVETVSDWLDRQRILSMSRKGTQYLYLYRLEDGYYLQSLEDTPLTGFDETLLNDSGVKICNNSIEISIEKTGEAPVLLEPKNQIIRIVFKRSGVFNVNADGTNTDRILFQGNGGAHTIRLIEETGKHIVD